MGIRTRIYQLITALIPQRAKDWIIKENNQFLNISYSQEGEDLILNRIFTGRRSGFYVDVGAHHPKRLSNTYKFYLKGWKGINIDALPGMKVLFDRERPNDINVEVGVSKYNTSLKYYSFNEPALNTFDSSEAEKKDGQNGYFVKEIKTIATTPLSQILDEHLPSKQAIDFMTIDVEGFDLEVLESNDWDRYKPTYILIEELRTQIEVIRQDSSIYRYLLSKGYCLYYRTYNTSFYKAVK